MKRPHWNKAAPDAAELATARAERAKSLLGRMRMQRPPEAVAQKNFAVEENVAGQITGEGSRDDDLDYSVLAQEPNPDLMRLVDLFDEVLSSDICLHLGLAWPHIPPRLILPWMLREVCRGRERPPIRTLFINVGRPALRTIAHVNARPSRLRARGVYRSGIDATNTSAKTKIAADAHFYMFLGDTRNSSVDLLPLISIVPHSVAMNDGVFWRDFDEKTLKGFKRFFDLGRLQSIRRHLDLLTSAHDSPNFAFMMPSHFDRTARRHALAALPGTIEFIVVDMSAHAVRGRDASELLRSIFDEIEGCRATRSAKVLVMTDCPLRFSFLLRSAKNRRDPGSLGNRVKTHRLVWSVRDNGWSKPADIRPASPPTVTTIASQESVIASRLWRHAQELDDENALKHVLIDAASALKGMALTAAGADILLAPYGDTHDAYHRIKRERHSFEPHYNKALGLIADGRGGRDREAIERDLKEAFSLALLLRTDTPLLRYLKRALDASSRHDDFLVVLRHPEDAQQTNIQLLDYLTEPGRFQSGIPDLRVTTPSRYSGEVSERLPTCVIWAASPVGGTRAFVGDTELPAQFRILVAGQDVITIKRILGAANEMKEYAAYHGRIRQLQEALPNAPKELGDITVALTLDPDKPRAALPFVGHGYLLLDGYGRIAAGPNTILYFLDPVTQDLAPHEARSVDIGDAVFVMSDHVREEIEAVLREKDDKGRTLEQAMVDQYKVYVKAGIDALSKKEGRKVTAARVHELLFEQNPTLPPIGKQAVDYWLQAADKLNVDTPYAASNPIHFEAFLRLMGAGVMARQLTDAIRIVRAALQRDGYTNRSLFDRLLLDPDSLMHTRRVTFERLKGLRQEALESVYPVLEKHLEVEAKSQSTEAIAS